MRSTTNLGDIVISAEAIASLAGNAASECYGVVGMASKKFFQDGLAVLLKKENYSKGIVVQHTSEGLILDLYIIVCYGVNITNVCEELQEKVKYELGRTLDIEFKYINVYVQGVKVID
jgi:uncharacterized alkaline shock family protein YloU